MVKLHIETYQNFNERVGRNLKYIRKLKSLTQLEVAYKLGYEQCNCKSTVSRDESGKVTFKSLYLYSQIYGLSIGTIVDLDLKSTRKNAVQARKTLLEKISTKKL